MSLEIYRLFLENDMLTFLSCFWRFLLSLSLTSLTQLLLRKSNVCVGEWWRQWWKGLW